MTTSHLNKKLLPLALLASLAAGIGPVALAKSPAITIETSEEAMFTLERALGKLLFEPAKSPNDSAVERNDKRFKELREAPLPFHEYMLTVTINLKSEIEVKNQVDPLAFNVLDRGLFGYQALLRKLLEIENAKLFDNKTN